MQIKNHYKLEKISQKKKISDNHKVVSSSLGVKHFFHENLGEIEARCMGSRQSLASCFWIEWINVLACSYFGRLLSLLDPILVHFCCCLLLLTLHESLCLFQSRSIIDAAWSYSGPFLLLLVPVDAAWTSLLVPISVDYSRCLILFWSILVAACSCWRCMNLSACSYSGRL